LVHVTENGFQGAIATECPPPTGRWVLG